MTFFVGLVVLIADAALVAWPLYSTWPFLVVTLVAFALAAAVSWISARARFSWIVQVLIAVLAGILLGAPLTHLDRLASLGDLTSAYAGTLRSLISGWKELLTVPLPAGSYGDVLVPWFVVTYAGVLVSLGLRRVATRLAQRAPGRRVSAFGNPWGWMPALAAMLPLVFALAFSSPSVGNDGLARLLGLIDPARASASVAVAQVIVGLTWMAGGFLVARGTRTAPARRSPVSLARRLVSAVSAVVVVSVAVGAVGAAVATTGIPGTRVALRQDIEPAQTLALAPSPLALYRESFVNPERFGATALTYSASPSGGDGRVRIAVLPFYDGTVFTASSNGVTTPGFQRLPVPLSVSGATETIELGLPSNPTVFGPWLPVVDNLASVSVTTPDRDLYVNAQTQAAVLVPESSETEPTALTYQVVRGVETTNPSLDELERPDVTGSLVAPDLIPTAMSEWIRLQGVPVADGADLQTLVDRLRARGYLSHSLTAPTDGDTWITPLLSSGYAFQPSLAGHSIGRLDAMFGQLIDKQRQAPAGASDDRLVAAVGDNEQFAAAVALLAMSQGFPARVVTGFVTNPAADAALTVPTCADGVCRGANLTAWVEVQGADGSWAVVDVDPQFVNPVAPESEVQQEPQLGTSVTNDTATVLPPAAITPESGTVTPTPDVPPVTFDWVLPLLRIVGLVLLIALAIMAPFVAILWVKAARRRSRRRARNPRERIVGAWEEYLDTALDLGIAVSPSLTRREVATALERPHLLPLADGVDRAVFGTASANDAEAAEFWRLVDSAKGDLEADASWWRILTARFSLASFLRYRTADLLPRERAGFVTLASGDEQRPTGIGGFTRYVTRSTRRRLRGNGGE